MPPSSDLLAKAKAIRLIAMDVDGVLTNGDIIYTQDDIELKVFNAKDGHGLAMLNAAGFELAWITGRKSAIVERRAKELGVKYVFQGARQKWPILEQVMAHLKLTPEQVFYMGDDTPDIGCLEKVGLAACPADAVEQVKAVCHVITQAGGGKGAIREMADLILSAQGLSLPEAGWVVRAQ